MRAGEMQGVSMPVEMQEGQEHLKMSVSTKEKRKKKILTEGAMDAGGKV